MRGERSRAAKRPAGVGPLRKCVTHRRPPPLLLKRQHVVGTLIVAVSLKDKLVVKIDDGQHARDADRMADAYALNVLRVGGCQVRRFWNNEVLSNADAGLARCA